MEITKYKEWCLHLEYGLRLSLFDRFTMVGTVLTSKVDIIMDLEETIMTDIALEDY